MRNIVLIGMPGAGKSTVGVLLAKSMLMSFYDTDLLIQNTTGKSLCDIIKDDGIEAFIKLEETIISDYEFCNSVVATGGSAVYGENAMKKLRENGVVVYLKVTPDELNRRVNNIHTRGIAMKEGTDLIDLYIERVPLYKKYANITIDCNNKTAEQCVNEIVKKLSQN